jgi:Sigma-70, region 4
VTSAERQPSYLDTEILRLIEESAVSVRLSNALHAASGLPIETIRDYLDAGPEAKLRFLRLPNLGRKSANELDELIRAFARDGNELPPPANALPAPSQTPPPPSVRERLLELFQDDHFPAVLLENGVSKRLDTCLLNQRSKPLSRVLSTWQTSCVALLGQHNVGRHSIVELSKLALDHIRKKLRGFGFTPEEIAASAPIILMVATPDTSTAAALERRLNSLESNIPAIEPQHQTLDEAVSSFFNLLDERERDVLMRRYGYPNGEIETLESISKDYGVTRERIRQIESKALRKLSVPAAKRAIDAAFGPEKASLPTGLHGGCGYVKDGDVFKAFESLPAIQRVAIDILFKDRYRLLKQLAARFHGGWLFQPLVASELDGIAKELRRTAKKLPLPNTLALLAGSLPADLVIVAVEIATNLSLFEGYVTDKWFGRRLKRAVRLHRELAGAKVPLEIRELVASYHKSCPTDLCSVRDAIIVMYGAPHLFIELQDGVWTAIGQPPLIEPSPTEPRDTSDTTANNLDEPSDQTIRLGLRDILRRRGPLRFVDLRSEAAAVLGKKHTSSVGPILLTSGSFVRPLPGVYALPDQLPALSNIAFDPPAFLLSEEQARWLAMARFAGEPFGSFPLWRPEVEYALCRWGETKATANVWQSLLAVASIDQWPVSDLEKEHWRSLQSQNGTYGLSAAIRYPIRQLWPPLHRVLAAMHVIRMRDGLNWMVGNRLLKRRVDAHASAALLGILSMLGALQPPPQWQMPHPKRNNTDELIDALSNELQRTGTLSWESDTGAQIIATLLSSTDISKDAWLIPSLVAELRSVAEENPVDTLSVPAESDDDAISFEKLLQDVARQQQLATIQEDIRNGMDKG